MIVFALLAAACGSPGQARPAPSLPPASATPTRAPSLTGLPSPTLTPAPSLPPSPSPTLTPSFTPGAVPVSLPKESVTIYHPNGGGRHVVTVQWSGNGQQIFYALSPLPDEYLLKWYLFSLNTQGTRSVLSPLQSYIEKWSALGLGYPDNFSQATELLGYVSPGGKYLLFPNAGFPNIVTIPNYIYLISSESGLREPILGPTFAGTVGKASWIDLGEQVIFDYRYADGVLIYLSKVRTGKTFTFADLRGDPKMNAEWSLAPNQSVVFLPARGTSQIVSLSAAPLYTFETPHGVINPRWASYSQAIYYWENGSNLLWRYSLGSGSTAPVLDVADLVGRAPVIPIVGMPFSVSPDEKSIAFWFEDWIWTVSIP